MFKTHYFASSGEAYDKSQTGYYRSAILQRGPRIGHLTNEAGERVSEDFDLHEGLRSRGMYIEDVYTEVADGDLMVIPNEGIYGFLYEAWPVAVDPDNHGAFQVLKEGFWDVAVHNQKYGAVYQAALLLNELHEFVDPKRYEKV